MKFVSLSVLFVFMLATAAVAQEYQRPQIKTLDNGFRYIISPAQAGEPKIVFDLIQEMSAFDELPGEEGMLLLYKSIPIDSILPDAQTHTSVYPSNFSPGHGGFGRQSTVLSSLTSSGLTPESYPIFVDMMRRLAAFNAPSAESIAAGRQGALAKMGNREALNRSATFSGDGALFQISVDTNIWRTRADAFMADGPLSLLGDDNPPTTSQMGDFLARVISPQRAILVVSGPMDAVAMERAIKAAFSDWKPSPRAEPPVRAAEIPQGRTKVFVTPDEKTRFVSLRFRTPGFRAAKKPTHFKQEVAKGAAQFIQDYLIAKMDEAGYDFDKKISVRADENASGFDVSLSDQRVRRVDSSLWVVLVEMARLQQNGLPPSAVAAVKKHLTSARNQPPKQTGALPSIPPNYFMARGEGLGVLVDQGFDAQMLVVLSNPFLRPNGAPSALSQSAFNDYQARIQGLTPTGLNAIVKPMLESNLLKIVSVGPENAAGIFEPAFDRFVAFQAEELDAPVSEAGFEFGYSKFGTPGRVTNREEIAELDSWKLTFANNVVLYYHNREDAGPEARFHIQVGDPGAFKGGKGQALLKTITSAEPNLDLGLHDAETLQEWRNSGGNGQRVSLGSDTGLPLTPSVFTPSADIDFPTMLSYAAARLSDTRIDRAVIEQAIATLATPSGPFRLSQAQNGDPYGALPVDLGGFDDGGSVFFGLKPEDHPSVDQATAGLRDVLENHAVRIVYSGSKSREDVIEMVAETLGALPKRRALVASPLKTPATAIPFGSEVRWPAKAQDGRGAYAQAYPLPLDLTAKDQVTLDLLAKTMDATLLEQLTAAGFAGTSARMALVRRDGYRTGHYIWARAWDQLDRLPAMEAQMDRIITVPDLLSAAGFEKARSERLTALNMLATFGPAVPGLLASLEYRQLPRVPQEIERQIIEEVTLADLKRLQARLLDPSKRLTVRFGY